MSDTQDRELAALMGKAILIAESWTASLRDEILATAAKLRSGLSFERLTTVGNLLDSWGESFKQMLLDSNFASVVAGIESVVSRLPGFAVEAIAATKGMGMIVPPPSFSDLVGGDQEPIIRWPVIEEAVNDLLGRQVMLRDEFDELTAQQRREVFTVAQQANTDTLERIRESVSLSTQTGETIEDFKDRLGDELQSSFIGPAHVENVFRTNMQTAYHNAHEKLADHPVVREMFPYEEYLSIRDARVRPEHEALGRLGMNGTGIYRRDDPFWDVFRPPWGYQCRCGTNLLTIEAAARKGVHEARRWLRTGQAPIDPEWRLDDIPFRPDPDFSGRAAA